MQNVSHVKLNCALIHAVWVIFQGTLHTVDGPEKKVEFGGPRGSPRVDFSKNEPGAAPGPTPNLKKLFFTFRWHFLLPSTQNELTRPGGIVMYEFASQADGKIKIHVHTVPFAQLI